MASIIFFFNDTATTEIYTLSLHDALPIWKCHQWQYRTDHGGVKDVIKSRPEHQRHNTDRKSTRLNSSHDQISYAVFCLKKKISEGTAPISVAALPQKMVHPAPARPRGSSP